MTLADSIHAQRLCVVREAEQSGNVSATCRRYGWSRARFYELRKRFRQYGPDGLRPKPQAPGHGRPPTLTVEDERRIVALAVAWPTRGPQWYSDQLARDGYAIPRSTVWRCLRRAGLNHRAARLVVLEQAGAAKGILTERTLRRHTGRHLEANEPGALLSLDLFYVGKLKGVGKVWQITACDVATSYGWAQVVAGEVTAARVLAFLTTRVLPAYQEAGWALRTVLTDNGKEFKTAFDGGCQVLGLQHRRTKPRHAWTNGAVERFQGTILHEHWRIAFRREYFGSVRALQRSLDGFLRFYNRQRAHHGHRLNGRTPASAFIGASAA
jgi:transposase InsO family protein